MVTMDFVNGLQYWLLWAAVGLAMASRVRWEWLIPAGLSVVAAVGTGIVEWEGAIVIAVFAGACLAAGRSTLSQSVRAVAWGIVVISGTALFAHQVPWIHNVRVVDAVVLSPSAAPYTLYWNYDKGVVGLLLYALCVQPQPKTPWRRTVAVTAAAVVLTPALLVVPALAMEYVAWAPKWPAILILWVPANLLVTCLAEETVFRGLLQRHLSSALSAKVPAAGLVALIIAAAAFGLAHLGGGVRYVLLATLAGIGYGAGYYVTRRVEVAVLLHFSLNLVHLTLFTYPFVASG